MILLILLLLMAGWGREVCEEELAAKNGGHCSVVMHFTRTVEWKDVQLHNR